MSSGSEIINNVFKTLKSKVKESSLEDLKDINKETIISVDDLTSLYNQYDLNNNKDIDANECAKLLSELFTSINNNFEEFFELYNKRLDEYATKLMIKLQIEDEEELVTIIKQNIKYN